MHIPHVQISWKGYRLESVRPDRIINVIAEPDAPRGRKARLMADYWQQVRSSGAAGILWQDPDIICDPDDINAMLHDIDLNPDLVRVAAHKLWPASTMRDDWVWAHGRMSGQTPVMTQSLIMTAEWFALGLTYTPRRLLDLAAPHMPAWHFGQVDSGLAATARQHRIPGLCVKRSRPKHLHFYPREGDVAWPANATSGQ